jgi:S-adenosylmethionine synthetase
MKAFSEYVSLGHPDKIADYISQYLLDRYIEQDPDTKYAVEVQIKNYKVTLGGEVSSTCKFSKEDITKHVRDAVNDIGYTKEYAEKWGYDNTVCGDLLEVDGFINQQSPDIAQGLDGWGDQGIFFGYADYAPQYSGMPKDHTIAKQLCKALFESGIGGLDIKTQVVTNDGDIETIIVAIPLLEDSDRKKVKKFIKHRIKGRYKLIINGTGRYVRHSSIADCGTTGRKLVVDFYGGNSKIGGGSPWTKDASKADLTLNLCARKLALGYAKRYKVGCTCAIACCIGQKKVDVSIRDFADNILFEGQTEIDPKVLKQAYSLDKPIFASMCRWGLFGEYQSDKMWEK